MKIQKKRRQSFDLLQAQKQHAAGNLFDAEIIYKKILERDHNQPDALHLLGVLAHQLNDPKKAIKLISRALTLRPDFSEAFNNLGNAYIDLKLFKKAIESYNSALKIKKDYQIAQNNLANAFFQFGNHLNKKGRYEEAKINYVESLKIKPNNSEANYNLGVTFSNLEKYDEAEKSYRASILINPNHAEPYSNLGNVLVKLKKNNEAIESYKKAVLIKSDYAEAYLNMGIAYRNAGDLHQAKASYEKALAIRPDFEEVWNNLKYAVKVLQNQGQIDKISLDRKAEMTADFAFLQFYLDSFKPHNAESSFRKAISALPLVSDQTIWINSKHSKDRDKKPPQRMVSLLHFGRSGTGLLHSLVDNHPEITTLPSIFLSGYFNRGVWEKLSADGWENIPNHFVNEFAVLFDTRNSAPIPGRFGEDRVNIGEKEGMITLGENRNEHLEIDTEKFCKKAKSILSRMKTVNPMSFFRVIHDLIEETDNKKLCFYHIHNPDHYAHANYLRYVKNSKILMMIREPLDSCQSWLRSSINNNYSDCIFKIMTMLYDIDQVAFRFGDARGLRLEDLKTEPKKTLNKLCEWLEINESPNLFQMTAQGKKWWGDPSSPSYSEKHSMSAFGEKTNKQSNRSILSQKDKFILKTLFYPFSVRFGYQDENKKIFQKNLCQIRPMIENMLDFETNFSKQMSIETHDFKQQEAYQLFHTGLLERWRVLNELEEYPNMLEPLKI